MTSVIRIHRAGQGRYLASVASVLATVMMLNACSLDRMGPAAPFTHAGVEPTSMSGHIIAMRGDTVDQLAARYGINARDIIAANRLTPPYDLAAGQRLVLPYPLQYQVKSTDTLYSIARMFSLLPTELARYNNIPEPYTLKPGQMIRIPSGALPAGGTADGFRSFTIEEAEPLPAQKIDPVEVERLKSSARESGGRGETVVASTAATKQKPQPSSRKPPDDSDDSFARVLGSIISEAEAAPVADKSLTAKRAEGKTGKSAAAPLTPPRAEPVVYQATIVPAARRGYAWPLKGKVISTYGPKPNKLFNDGVNIAAPRGTPVGAAADGVVAYVGNNIPSYGNIVLVRHSDGIMTAYAHLQKISVAKGAAVRRGQVVGTVGSSGKVSASQLHFEVRKGRKSVDPHAFLNRAGAS